MADPEPRAVFCFPCSAIPGRTSLCLRNTVSLYHLSVTVHVIAAVFWIGGMLFIAVVGAPVLRKADPELRARLFGDLGVQFRWTAWIAIAALLITGLTNMYFRGLLSWRVLGDMAFWGTTQGMALAWKLLLVSLMIGNAAIHDFVVGPTSSRARDLDGGANYDRLRRAASYMGRLNAVLALILIYVAVRLTRG